MKFEQKFLNAENQNQSPLRQTRQERKPEDVVRDVATGGVWGGVTPPNNFKLKKLVRIGKN